MWPALQSTTVGPTWRRPCSADVSVRKRIKDASSPSSAPERARMSSYTRCATLPAAAGKYWSVAVDGSCARGTQGGFAAPIPRSGRSALQRRCAAAQRAVNQDAGRDAGMSYEGSGASGRRGRALWNAGKTRPKASCTPIDRYVIVAAAEYPTCHITTNADGWQPRLRERVTFHQYINKCFAAEGPALVHGSQGLR